jgi:hypothetical protein
VALQGYHPYAEDGGLYMAGIKHLVDPALYPHGTEFVTEHLRFSAFAPAVAGAVRLSHLSVETVLFLLHVASFWMVLAGAWLLTGRCFASRIARAGAVCLLAVWLTLPIAGTALLLMDPYVTARSISTPCALFALAGMLMFRLPGGFEVQRGHGMALCCAVLAIAATMHPLMAADALGCVLLLGLVTAATRRVRVWGTLGLCVIAVVMAGLVCTLVPPDTASYRQVAVTRYYWFLSQWHWYELVGVAAPLIILGVIAFGRRREGDAGRVALARMGLAAGVTALVMAVLFARISSANYLIARLQPLRVFQLVYVVMIIMLGAALAEYVLKRRRLRWLMVFAVLGGVMFFVERQTYPSSSHMELQPILSGVPPQNKWEQAFAWIRRNSPKDALFAMDADYIAMPGEDAQCFRAMAERSALPDYSKDGGEASITPALASDWALGQSAQAELSLQPDAERIRNLLPLGVTWIVLEKDAVTSFTCDYSNDAVKVCRLP